MGHIANQDARVRELAAQGMCVQQIANAISATHRGVAEYCRTRGIQVQRGVGGGGNRRKDWQRDERAQAMVLMYRQGIVLRDIGEKFGVTRERVRQILRKCGIEPELGGVAFRSANRRAATEAQRDARYIARHGVTFEMYKTVRDAGLIAAYRNQENAAKARGIKWGLTLGQWVAIWQASGKLAQRGRGKGHYCMSRIRDAGGYEVGNVHIQPCEENSREAVKQWEGKTKAIKGVFCLFPGTARPWVARVGRKQVGRFATAEEGEAARAEYFRMHGDSTVKLGCGRGWTFRRGRYCVQVVGTKAAYFDTPEEARAEYLRRCAEIQAARSAAKADPAPTVTQGAAA